MLALEHEDYRVRQYGERIGAGEDVDYGAERAAAKADFEVLHANRAKYGAQVVIQRAVAGRRNPSAGADIAQAHQGFARERMVKAASDDVAPRQYLHKINVWRYFAIAYRQDAQIERAALQAADDFGDVTVVLVNMHAGVFKLKVGEHFGDDAVHQERRTRQAHGAAMAIAKARHQLVRRRTGSADLPTLLRQRQAELGGNQGSAVGDK